MLEILAIIALCRVNSRNADMRGRSTAWAKGYTVLLWLFFEFGSAIFFIMLFDILGMDIGFLIYPLVLLGAGLGALLSWFVAKRGDPIREAAGNLSAGETAAIQNAQSLSRPCGVTVIREKSFVGMAVKIDIHLNGKSVGKVGNGETLSFSTDLLFNVVTANDAFGTRLNTSVSFDAPEGGSVEVFIKNPNFLPSQTKIYQENERPYSAGRPS